ncbi:MAG TPA: fumarylacetoacetate hydrolase family protein [Candidatus Saccharimonadaceae bacterium]|nr:fumarylacetoacetate hydrolase family protein [Candidatus Saccharimonadaceae bacterium]
MLPTDDHGGLARFFSERSPPVASSDPPVTRIARYRIDGSVHYGACEGDAYRRMSDAPWRGGEPTGHSDPQARTTPLAPCEPTKIVCVGLNYRAHVAESTSLIAAAGPPSEPLLFLKPPSAVIGPGAPIRYPAGVTRLDPEGELAVVIGRRATRVAVADALDHVAGLTAFNDVSARNYQKSDGQWARAKGFDTFAPIGPVVVCGLDWRGRTVECRVNGETRQRASTDDLLFDVPFLVSFISGVMTLEPGDVIATGTPAGVAPIHPGDRVCVEISGVGALENAVESGA